MTHLWDNLHERRSKSKDLKAKYSKSPFGNKKPSLIAIFMDGFIDECLNSQ